MPAAQNHDIATGSRHSRELVQALATQTSRPLDEAQSVFESQFQELERGARVKIYLPAGRALTGRPQPFERALIVALLDRLYFAAPGAGLPR